ncbi:MAG: UpxY family transcription antiterminator [Bacteroidales bacterium]|nr:UpxY family transcription antiterminator [Bacteroidales bacterium]
MPNAPAPPLINRSYHWYALYTKSRREKEVERDLIEDGYEVYLPTIRKLHQWIDRKKWVEVPLFSGYIFVRVSHREYFNVLQHPGAVKYVSFGGEPSQVPDNQVEAVKRVLGENLDFEVTTDRFKPGEIVEIGVGPMSGQKGEIIRIAGKKKLLIRIGEIGYSLVVNVPVAYLETS